MNKFNEQEAYDRANYVITNNGYLDNHVEAELYGTKALGIKSDLGMVQLEALKEEFKYIHFLDGQIVLCD